MDEYGLERASIAGPVLMASSIWVAVLGSILPSPPFQSILTSTSVGMALVGGMFEIYTLLHVKRFEDLTRTGRVRTLRNLFVSSALTGLFFTLAGVLLIAKVLKDSLEYTTGKVLEETRCSQAYRPLLFIATLGMYLAPFQACVSSTAAEVGEDLELLGLEGDQGE